MDRSYLGAGEIRRFTVAENVVTYYHDRQRSDNWVTWARDNDDGERLLAMAVTDDS